MKKYIITGLLLFQKLLLCTPLNLQLELKRQHIPVYDWCMQIAKEDTEHHEKELLINIGVTKEALESKDQVIFEKYKTKSEKAIAAIKKETIPSVLEKEVKKIVNLSKVQELFGIRHITYQKNKITIYTNKENIPKKITIIASQEKTHTVHNHINICINKIKKQPKNDFNVIIRHELGHMYNNHSFKSYRILQAIKNFKKAYIDKYTHSHIDKLFNQIKKAHEREASITSIFNDLLSAKKSELFFKKRVVYKNIENNQKNLHLLGTYIASCNSNTYLGKRPSYTVHPYDDERACCFNKIAEVMTQELTYKNNLTARTLFSLAKFEVIIGNYANAYKILASIKFKDAKLENQRRLLVNYTLAQLNLINGHKREAYELLYQCTKQDINNSIRIKSRLTLGVMLLNSRQTAKQKNGQKIIAEIAKQNLYEPKLKATIIINNIKAYQEEKKREIKDIIQNITAPATPILQNLQKVFKNEDEEVFKSFFNESPKVSPKEEPEKKLESQKPKKQIKQAKFNQIREKSYLHPTHFSLKNILKKDNKKRKLGESNLGNNSLEPTKKKRKTI